MGCIWVAGVGWGGVGWGRVGREVCVCLRACACMCSSVESSNVSDREHAGRWGRDRSPSCTFYMNANVIGPYAFFVLFCCCCCLFVFVVVSSSFLFVLFLFLTHSRFKNKQT